MEDATIVSRSHIVPRGAYGTLDLFGPTVEYLTSPDEANAVYCVMLGTIPPGVAVPLHSHADFESFYVSSGTVLVLSERNHGFEWLPAKAGEFVHVPGGAKHAFRNESSEPTVQLIISTPRIGRFLREVGRPVTPGVRLSPPTPGELKHFASIAAQYKYWTASPEENAKVGISLS